MSVAEREERDKEGEENEREEGIERGEKRELLADDVEGGRPRLLLLRGGGVAGGTIPSNAG